MKFKDQFYDILSSSVNEDQHQFTIRIHADHAIFDGHFPGNPVTPGVVQMEIVKELVGEASGYPVRMTSMGNCKFLAILNPQTDAEVDVSLKITKDDEGQLKVSASIQNPANTYLKMGASYLPC